MWTELMLVMAALATVQNGPGHETWSLHVPTAVARAAAGAEQTDTVFDVDPSARLEVRNHAGEIAVDTWDREQIRVHASHSPRDGVEVERGGSVVTIRSESRGFGPPSMIDFRITVPRTMAVNLSGPFSDMKVTGVRNDVSTETVKGFVTVRDCQGTVTARSVEGVIDVAGVKGRVELATVDEAITLADIQGAVHAETIDGDITMSGVDSRDVEARAVDGDVSYGGRIYDDGEYRLTTHDGDIVVAIPEGTNATVSVATFDGDFQADFPIQVTQVEARRRFSFTLGSGGARLELQSFDGDIRLKRP